MNHVQLVNSFEHSIMQGIIIIIIIKRQFIRRSNMARVTTRAPHNVRYSYSGRQNVLVIHSYNVLVILSYSGRMNVLVIHSYIEVIQMNFPLMQGNIWLSLAF